MLLSVRDMELRKLRFDVACRPGMIDLSDTEFRQRSALRIAGTAELLRGTDEIRVRGHIDGTLEGACDRCLELAPLAIDRDFELFYRPAATSPSEPELEIDESEAEIGYYEGDGLQLLDVLREQILLWLPMRWICNEDCKGLCPVCGGNRNQVRCDCRPTAVDDRWAALRSLRLPGPR